jgi:putative PIN family toxin of toxin-antitoxin system
MAVPQVVIDTNVIIAGLRSNRGGSFLLLQLIGTGKFEMNISVPLILEYQDVLLRQAVELKLSRTDVDDLINYYCYASNQHKIFYLWRPTLRDPEDEMLVELAVKARCDYIITFNLRDFKGIEQFGLAVVRPNEFLKTIGVK